MSDNNITNKDLTKMFWRLNMLQSSWNYERMQALGYLYSMVPVLKKVYKDEPKEERAKACQRHLEFFNTMPTLTAPILGITAALEEKQKNEAGSAISALKVSLMGPLAGLGDGVIWLTWLPIWFSIGAAFAIDGNIFGPILAFVMFNILNQGIKFFGIRVGYKEGVKFIEKARDNRIIQRYSTMAAILGLIIVGGLIPQMVSVYIPFVLEIQGVTVAFQQVLDDIVPMLLPLLITLGVYSRIKKGVSLLKILFVILIGAIVLAAIGVLG